jgi:hypothetical protein
MHTAAQFRIAVRIHYALKPHLGDGIDVASLLRRSDEAREVLMVCRSIGTSDLLALALQYEAATREAAVAEAASLATSAPQELDWSRNTSGFAVSQPPAHADAEPKRRWFGLGSPHPVAARIEPR